MYQLITAVRAMIIVAGRLMLQYVDPYNVLYAVVIAIYAMEEWTETRCHTRYISGGVCLRNEEQ